MRFIHVPCYHHNHRGHLLSSEPPRVWSDASTPLCVDTTVTLGSHRPGAAVVSLRGVGVDYESHLSQSSRWLVHCVCFLALSRCGSTVGDHLFLAHTRSRVAHNSLKGSNLEPTRRIAARPQGAVKQWQIL